MWKVHNEPQILPLVATATNPSDNAFIVISNVSFFLYYLQPRLLLSLYNNYRIFFFRIQRYFSMKRPFMSYMSSLIGMNILKSVSWVISFLLSFPCRWQRADCAKCSCWMTGSWSCWFRYERSCFKAAMISSLYISHELCHIPEWVKVYGWAAYGRQQTSYRGRCVSNEYFWMLNDHLQFCGPIILVEYWSNHMLHVKIPVLIICQPPSVLLS